MASSSLSQESLDIEDYQLNARRTRIRTLRARGVTPRGVERETDTSVDGKHCEDDNSVGQGYNGSLGQDHVHESPTRTSAAQRAKDKRNRPNHLQKGKDKRRLREKRRSTGVAVHLVSTESTGDSLDDDDAEDKLLNDAKRNTPYNEVIDADNPQTPSEVMRRIHQFQSLNISSQAGDTVPRSFVSRHNKSPSDLEADLEDNQDYDSTVSQSDTNLTLIGQPTSRDSDSAPSVPARTYNQSKYSSEHTSFRSNLHNDVDSTTTNDNTPLPPTYSALSRHRKDNQMEGDKVDMYRSTNGPKSPKLPLSPKSTSPATREPHREPVRPVASVLAQYQARDKERREEPATSAYSGYRSRFKDREFGMVRGPIGQQFASSLNKENREDDLRRVTKELDRERDENQRLQKVLEEKDRRIADLERGVAMMNRDIEDFQEENDKILIENRALIQAVQKLSRSTNV